MNVKGCEHLEHFKSSEDGLKTYKIIHSYFVVCSVPGSRKAKIENCFCMECNQTLNRLHSCLYCVYFGCIDHIEDHYLKENHYLAIDLTLGHVICFECSDYQYDTEFENIRKSNETEALRNNKRTLTWEQWDVSPAEKHLMKYHYKRVNIKPQSLIGLRGLLNLGATCFMNCIVQTLMHTPLLRDYFLAERHHCKNISGSCLVCEFSRLFQEFYKGSRSPLALNKLMHLIWTNSKSLAGYEQRDAHEFLLATLDILHEHCLLAMSPVELKNGNDCSCIIDQIFTGGMQSDVVCQKCKGVSTTFEPITVISLDLTSSHLDSAPPTSLLECLERYTRAEHLGSKEGELVLCSNCNSYEESTKQLTVKTLPIVISFHLKRSEHLNQIDKKISSFISFPEMLDMSPFMSKSSSISNDLATDNRYSLFAVVNHCGEKSNTGHYTAYIRQQRNHWYECNDDKINRTNLKQVLSSEGYLLFYHKHILEYE